MNMISIIACISKDNRAIGYQNRLLYHLPSDMVRFRELTTGHTIVMGRKTFESLPNGALPHRRNIVVSKSLKEIDGGEVYPTLEEALRAAQGDSLSAPKEDAGIASPEEIFIIGGESIYRQALPAARKLYLTIVDKEPEQADTFFPAIDSSAWEVTEKEMRNENGLSFSFLTYIRKQIRPVRLNKFLFFYCLIFLIRNLLDILQRKLTVDGCIEGDDGLASGKTQWLQLIVDNLQEMVVVDCINLDEHIKTARSIMTLYYLRNLLEFFYHLIKLLRFLEEQSHICTGFVTNLLWIDNKLRAFNNAKVSEFSYTLMNGSTAYITSTCYFQKWNSGILRNQLQNMPI